MTAQSTYTLISTQLISTPSSVTFSNIPQIYTDLFISYSGSPAAAGSICYQINGDSGNNYNGLWIYENSGTLGQGTYSGSVNAIVGWSVQFTGQSAGNATFLNYTNTNMHKQSLGMGTIGSTVTETYLNVYRSTNPIQSIYIFPNGSSTNFNAGTIISLYGVTSA